MDDFIIDYFEGGHYYDRDYDPDLHRDLDLEIANDYNDGPFAPLAHAVLPHLDFDDYHIQYQDGSEGSDFGGVELDGHSQSSESSSEHSDSGRSESSVPESLDDRSLGENLDDSDEEEVLEAYGIPYQAHQDIHDRELDESDADDYGSLPSYDDEELPDHPVHGRADQSEDDNSSQSEEEAIYPAVDQWEDHLAEVEDLSDSEVAHSEPDLGPGDFAEDHSGNDSSDEEVLANSSDTDDDRASQGHSSDSSGTHLDDAEVLRRRYRPSFHDRVWSDEDDDSSASDGSIRNSSSPSDSEPSPAPHSPPPEIFHHPRGFDAFRDDLDDLHQERQRLQEDLAQLRDIHSQFGNPHPPRRANGPNDIDYFLDRLPAPQRDAHGLLAQMEMDLERDRQRRRAAPSPIQAPPRNQQHGERTYIDLTEDSPPPEVLALPDAPRFAAGRSASRDPNPFAPRAQHRHNPRRNHLARRTPSFARSDGSFLGARGAQEIIDLTDDIPEVSPPPEPRAPRRLARRNHRNDDAAADQIHRNGAWGAPNMNALFRQIGFPGAIARDYLHQMHIAWAGAGGANGPADYDVEFIGENIRQVGGAGGLDHFPVGNLENPLADNPIDFNYGANGFNQEAARPKPAHIAPPEPRAGFTRGTGEDTVVVCPSCEQELQNDPDGDGGGAQPPPAKKARTTKKDREEHHFWAVKACGHVSHCLGVAFYPSF